jgi:hypothetical protein
MLFSTPTFLAPQPPAEPFIFSVEIQGTKAGGIEIQPLSEHQNQNLENIFRTTATPIIFARKFLC